MESASTIAAIASPPGPGLRGVIRVSGPAALRLARATCRFDDASALGARGAWRGRFDDGTGSQPLLALWMPGPRSYTREDVLELHLCGSPPLLAAALARLVELGAELARPGEFTRRAFAHGRIDLLRAEGVLALIEAANEAERRAASALLFGGLSQRVAALRARLLELRVLCEASLDFDEADTGHVPAEELERLGAAAHGALAEALGWEQRRARRGGLPRVVLAGPPNAGKSTLFNALTGAGALVSELAGTTRDTLTARWNAAGLECELVDTAGLSGESAEGADGDDPDHSAQRMSRAEHQSADLVLRLCDARGEPPAPRPGELSVLTQLDRPGARPVPPGALAVCAPRGAGLAELARAVAQALGGQPGAGSGAVRELGARHVAALRQASESLSEALALLAARGPLDLVAEGLRAALDALDAIDGRTTSEELLDALFARFCIGK